MVVSQEHIQSARRIRQVYSNYQRNRDLISIGAYTKGTDPRIDLAMNAEPAINAFLQQGTTQVINFEHSTTDMATLSGGLGKG
jgi:flagellum-specific ATP synthase